LIYVIRYRLCFLSKLYIYCFLSSSDRGDDISKPVATMDYSSEGWMMSPCLSLLGAIVAMSRRHPSLLSNHCSAGRLPVAIVAYDPLLQCMFVLVRAKKENHNNPFIPPL
jgi:hypothetical protein